MTRQVDAAELNDTSFWKLTGCLLNKSACQTSIDCELTLIEDEIKKLLKNLY